MNELGTKFMASGRISLKNFFFSMNYRNSNTLRVLQCREYIRVALGIPLCPSCLNQDEIATKSDRITLYAGSACFVYIVRQRRMRLCAKIISAAAMNRNNLE